MPLYKNKYIIALIILSLAITAGYLIFGRTKIENSTVEGVRMTPEAPQTQENGESRPVTPEELAELKKDPSAPDWIKNAVSCTWIGSRVFCKTEGE